MTRESMSTDTRKKEPAEGEAVVKCPHCYSDIDARASVCPHCGKNVKVKTAGYQVGSFLMAVGLLMLVFDILIFSTGFFLVLGPLLMLVGLVVRRNA